MPVVNEESKLTDLRSSATRLYIEQSLKLEHSPFPRMLTRVPTMRLRHARAELYSGAHKH